MRCKLWFEFRCYEAASIRALALPPHISSYLSTSELPRKGNKSSSPNSTHFSSQLPLTAPPYSWPATWLTALLLHCHSILLSGYQTLGCIIETLKIAMTCGWGCKNGILCSHKKEWNNAICSNMDGPRDYHTKWSKSARERQIPYDITYMWNLKYDTNEHIYETETDSQT